MDEFVSKLGFLIGSSRAYRLAGGRPPGHLASGPPTQPLAKRLQPIKVLGA